MGGEKREAHGGFIRSVTKFLEGTYPECSLALNYGSPFQLLVATILAAQCTDERVNSVTKDLFHEYPGAPEIASLSQDKLMEMIRPTGFFKNKARAISRLSDILVQNYGGEVPENMEELVALPGVGRKTASVILGECFGTPAIPVDTHVKRVSTRLGLTSSKNPDAIEEDLKKTIPPGNWWNFSMRLGWHGRTTCKARKPLCEKCGLEPLCPKHGV